MYLAWALNFQSYYIKEKKFQATDYAVTNKELQRRLQ